MYLEKRTVITIAALVLLIVAGFAFLIFHPGAKKAIQTNLEQSAPTTQTTP